MTRTARRFDGWGFLGAIALASCASNASAHKESSPPRDPEAHESPIPDPTTLPSPLPFKVGITRAEYGCVTEELATRLRKANLFTEVDYPLESSAQMDAALEIDIHRRTESDPTAAENMGLIFSFGMSAGHSPSRARRTVDVVVRLRVAERTVRTFRASAEVYVHAAGGGFTDEVMRAADRNAGVLLAREVVDEMSRNPAQLAAEISAGSDPQPR